MKMSTLTFASLLLIASVPLALAQGTYTQIDFPGALDTYCLGINAAGDISGSYTDFSGYSHGFLFSGGIYTTINHPGDQYTWLSGMNDLGQIVGGTFPVGYVYDIQTQTFTDFSYPGAFRTVPTSINDVGTIVGYFENSGSQYQGFALVGSTYKLIEPQAALDTYVNGISASGEVVGYATTTKRFYANFSFYRGKYRTMAIPAPGAVLYGISPDGSALVGQYSPSSGVFAGFLFQNKILTTLQFSGIDKHRYRGHQ